MNEKERAELYDRIRQGLKKAPPQERKKALKQLFKKVDRAATKGVRRGR